MMRLFELRVGSYVSIEGEDREFKVSDFEYGNFYIAHPVPISEDMLFRMGFTIEHSMILNSYSIDISRFKSEFKQISLTIQRGNQYIYLRQGDRDKAREEDNLITIFNSDLDGELCVHHVQDVYQSITRKELIIKNDL